MRENLTPQQAPASLKLVEPQAQFERINRAHEKWVRSEYAPIDPGPVQIAEWPEEFSVHAAVPGFDASELEVRLEARRATILGRRTSAKSRGKRPKVQNENGVSDLLRIIELPVDVDTRKAAAALKDGVLELTLPKSQSAAIARLEVRTA
jgi:HSP20 family protein